MKRPFSEAEGHDAVARSSQSRRPVSHAAFQETMPIGRARPILPKETHDSSDQLQRQGLAKRSMTTLPEHQTFSSASTQSSHSHMIEVHPGYSSSDSYAPEEYFTPSSSDPSQGAAQGTLDHTCFNTFEAHPAPIGLLAEPHSSPSSALLELGTHVRGHHGDPWHGLAYRDGTPAMVADSECYSSSSESGAGHPPTPPANHESVSARRGPLSPDGRVAANKVRAQGACVRCHLMRERCDLGTPCGRCSDLAGKARSWRLPCSREWLDERWQHLLPTCLTTQLNRKVVDNFVDNGMVFPREDSEMYVRRYPALRTKSTSGWHCEALADWWTLVKYSELHLTLGFGPDLIIDATEVDPVGPDLTQMHGFNLAQCFSMSSPPIVPRCIKVESILDQVKLWINNVLTDASAPWARRCFHREEPKWPGDVLGLVCQHYRSHSAVNTAIRLTIVSYIMSHSLTVPRGEVAALFEQLRHGDFPTPPEGRVCPRAVNRVVKSVVLPLLEHLSQYSVKALHQHLFPKTENVENFNESFSIAYCCLIVLGWTQNAVLERAFSGQQKGDYSVTLADAQQQVFQMEHELVDYIVELFHYRFKPKRSHSARPSSSTPFKRSLLQVLHTNADLLRPNKSVEESIGREDFKLRNVGRLLGRLCAPLLKH